MNRDFKKAFFICLLSVLLVVSNIICAKYTNFLDVVIGVQFVTYPFTFLCTLMILNLGDKREAYRSILVASIIQLLITISYTIVVNLGNQVLIPDNAKYVDVLFKVNETNILASVLAFILSHCALIYLYENFKKLNKELYGLVIGLLGAMIVDSIIYIVITLSSYEPLFVIDILLSNIIVSVMMVVILTVLFYILRDKKENIVAIKKMDLVKNNDLSVEEVVEAKQKEVKKLLKIKLIPRNQKVKVLLKQLQLNLKIVNKK